MEESTPGRPDKPRSNAGVWIILGLAVLFFTIVAALVVLGGRDRRPDADPLEELYVVPESLRMRTEPELNSAILANLSRGERLDQLGNQGTWVQVRRADGTVGWAERMYLETKSDHERRSARYDAIRLLPPLQGEVERKAPLYAGPGIFYPIIGELDAGARVTVYTRDHDFYAVDLKGDLGFAEVDAIDLSGAGAALFEVAASDEPEELPADAEQGTEDDLVPPVPELPGAEGEEPVVAETPIAEPERPAVQGGVYPGVPPGGTDPVVVDRVMPRYPRSARSSGVEGTVVVRAVVRRNGRVTNVQIVKDLPYGLGEAAANAVRRWRFRPATYQGEPIDVYYNVTVNFRLSD
ncbi:MAG TPA: TonB family protein [Thermoanaerobaculia bacterium]|nr:TonB family protein [Thermoanaerobaculia bacterium]